MLNIETKQLGFQLKSKKLVDVTLDYTTINNYTFFDKTDLNNSLLKPNQFAEAINYFRLKLSKEFRYGKFALNNTVGVKLIAVSFSYSSCIGFMDLVQGLCSVGG